MIKILAEKIHDNRFLRLIHQMLKAGYLEDWKYHQTLSGAPQGGVVSPILSNIYLHKLDVFVETVLIPQYTRGKRRKRNPEYGRRLAQIRRARARGNLDKARNLRRSLRQLPSGDPQDPGYRRLRYTRYADDHLLGFIGPKAEAEAIKDQLARFLRDDLALELNPDKTLITHARTRAARYLGYEIIVQHATTSSPSAAGRSTAPSRYGYRWMRSRPNEPPTGAMANPGTGRPCRTSTTTTSSPRSGPNIRGIVGYYLLATDVWRLRDLRWHAETSMLKTLGAP
jgi:hypothetical protein